LFSYDIIGRILAAFAQKGAAVLVLGFFALGFATCVVIAVLVCNWASELFAAHPRGRSQGMCNVWCRLAIAASIFLVLIASRRSASPAVSACLPS